MMKGMMMRARTMRRKGSCGKLPVVVETCHGGFCVFMCCRGVSFTSTCMQVDHATNMSHIPPDVLDQCALFREQRKCWAGRGCVASLAQYGRASLESVDITFCSVCLCCIMSVLFAPTSPKSWCVARTTQLCITRITTLLCISLDSSTGRRKSSTKQRFGQRDQMVEICSWSASRNPFEPQIEAHLPSEKHARV